MTIILTLALFLSMSLPPSLLRNASYLANFFHEKCVQKTFVPTKHPEALRALLCGEKITDVNLQENLQRTSLIHIFVISGSHLLLLDELLSILRIPLSVRFVLFFFYSLVASWQAPVVRAFLSLAIRAGLRLRALHLPPDLGVLITGLVTLVLFPTWWQSLSLQMSWCAALALCWGGLLRVRCSMLKIFLAQLAVFLLMTAPLWGFGSLHPLGILFNLFLAPIVAYALLPLSALAVFCSWGIVIFDAAMDLFLRLMPLLTEPVSLVRGAPSSSAWLWVWIFAWHCFMHLLRVSLWQGRDPAEAR
ncbi:MAG: ComEC/Rec2 family competence protein [Bdellovibrio sp.]|nr:ComEC/Rec2 family competence protein [Bdellovibrio sp.]